MKIHLPVLWNLNYLKVIRESAFMPQNIVYLDKHYSLKLLVLMIIRYKKYEDENLFLVFFFKSIKNEKNKAPTSSENKTIPLYHHMIKTASVRLLLSPFFHIFHLFIRLIDIIPFYHVLSTHFFIYSFFSPIIFNS